MNNKFQNALKEVKAEEQLKESTYAFLQNKVYMKKKRVTYKRFALALAAFTIILFIGIFSYNLYFSKTAYIDIDVNPSIELTLNRFDRVIGAHAYNDDGQKLLDAVDIQHMTYKEALGILIDQMAEKGYLQDTSLFTATLQMVNGDNEAQLLDALKAYLDSVLQGNEETLKEDIFIVDSDTKSHSHSQNLTPAKYLAILELQAYDPTATFESCRDHSISDIKQQTHRHMNRGNHQNNNSDEYHSDDTSEHATSSGKHGGNSHDSSDNSQSTSNAQHGNRHKRNKH